MIAYYCVLFIIKKPIIDHIKLILIKGSPLKLNLHTLLVAPERSFEVPLDHCYTVKYFRRELCDQL